MSRSKDLFIAALELSPTERATFLQSNCADDTALRTEVERLLETLNETADFLESPAIRRPDLIKRAPIGPAHRIGPYTISKLLGEGGMGVVWQADQAEPVRRTVALKLLKPGMDSQQVIARFEAERRALERMDHPNIAKVLDAGATDDGRPFVVMELVCGLAVTKYCDSRHFSTLDRIQLLIRVCRAVQHAHSKGIIHRDLKPSNILVREEDGHATPKVIDFGIARSVERAPEEISHTRAIVLLGTPAYISPEQALTGSEVDTRTDVYSLGAVLYELLCGAPPFDPHALAVLPADALLRTLREDDPPRPSRKLLPGEHSESVATARNTSRTALQRQLKGDIDRIVMKALAKEPARRYETAAALADDLERCLRHEPVMAADPSAGYVAAKFVRRYRASAVATVLVLFCLVAGTIISWLSMTRAVEAERRTHILLGQAKANEQRYRHQAFISDMNLASDALQHDDPKRLKELLDLHAPAEGKEEQMSFAWNFLQRRSTVPSRLIDRIGKPFYFVTFSPDGSTVAAASADSRVRFYDAKTHRKKRTLTTEQGEVNSVAFFPDGRAFATAGDDGTVMIWNAATYAPIRTIKVFDKRAYQIAFIDVLDQRWIAVCGFHNDVRMFDAETGEPRGKPLEHGEPVEAIAASRGGLLATASEDGIPRIWNVATGKLVRQGPDSGSRLISTTFSPDGRWALFGLVKPQFLIWDMRSKSKPGVYPTNAARLGEGEAAQSISFVRDSRTFALGDRGGVIRFGRLNAKGVPSSELTQGIHPRWLPHGDRIYSLAVNDEDRSIVSAGRDGQLIASKPFDDRPVPKVAGGGLFPSLGAVSSLSAGRDDLVSVASAEGAFLIDFERRLLQQVAGEPECDVIAHSDGGNLVVGGYSGVGLVAWLRSGETYREIWRHAFEGAPSMIKIRMTPDGRYVAALVSPQTSESKEVHLIDAATGKKINEKPVAGSFGLDLSRDGKLVAVSRDSEVLVLSVPSFEQLKRLEGHSLSVPAICFSPDGQWLATGAGDRKAILWDTKTWKPSPWIAAGGELRCISFSPDGDTLLTAAHDQVPVLWDFHTRRLLMHLPKVEGNSSPLRFTGSGKFIIGPHPKRGLYIFDGRPIKVGGGVPVKLR